MWPSTHVCYANYATIMISPESGWSISKCFEHFITGNLITETFPESNIVQIKSRVNSPLLYFELNRSFFFFFFLDLMKKQVGYGSNFAFIHRRFSWNEGSKQRDREEQKIMRIFLIFHRFPPWNTFHPCYHTRNFFQIYVPSENAFSRRMKISKVGRREIVVIKNFSSVVNSKQLTFNIFHTKVPWLANLEFHFSMC